MRSNIPVLGSDSVRRKLQYKSLCRAGVVSGPGQEVVYCVLCLGQKRKRWFKCFHCSEAKKQVYITQVG